MKYKKTNNWVKYVFTPSIAVVSAAAMLSGVVTPVAQAQTAPHQGAGIRDDGTLITEEHPWFSTFGANFEWADSRYKLATSGSDTQVNGWPLILGPNADTAGTNPVDRYDSLKGTGKDFSLELQQPEKIYVFGRPPGNPNAEYFSPSIQDGDGSGISIAARGDGPFQRLHENCFLAEGNDEGIDYATEGLAGQILHCKVTDANRAIVKVVFNPNPANPGESVQPVWNPAVKLSQAVTGEVGYATDFEYRIKTIDGVPAVNSGRSFGRFGSAVNTGRLGSYITDKGVEIRRTRESITSVNGNMQTPEWEQSNGTLGGGVSISGAVSTIEIELMPTVYIYDDPQVRQGNADITPGEDPVAPASTHGLDIELPSADLGVAKTGPAVAGLGDAISWKVTVTKNGSATGPSHGYVVADELPDFIDLSTVKVAKAEYGHGATVNAIDATVATAREIDGKQVLEIKRVAPGYTIERTNSPSGGLQAYLTADQGTGTLASPPIVLGNGEQDVYTITAKVRTDIDPAVIKKHENFVTVSGTDVDYRQGIRAAGREYESNSARAVTQIANNAVTYKLQSDGDEASRTQRSTDKDGAVAGSPAGVNVDAGRSVQEMFTSTDLTGATFKLTDPESGAEVESYILAGKGAYSIARDGVITFVAEKNYAGAAPAATAVVTTAAGETAKALYQPVVVPVLKNLSSVGTIDRNPVTVPLDTANKDIDPATVKFVDPATGTPVDGDLVVDGEGTWTVDPKTGAMTFTPLDTFAGDPTPVKYVGAAKETLADGTKVSALKPGTVTVTYPAALPKVEKFAVPGEPVTGIELPNLSEKIDPNSVRLGDNPDAPLTPLVVPGEGTWTLEVVNGKPVLKFEPAPNFKGVPSPVPLVAKDKNGQPATAGSVTIFPILTSIDEKGKTQHSTDDGAGDKGLPEDKLFPALKGKTFKAAFEDGQTTKTTPEGVFTVDPATGVVTFDPEDDFVGTAPTVTVVATAADDTVAKAQYTPVVIEPAVPAKTYGPMDTVQKSSNKDAAADGFPADEGKTVDEMFPGLVGKQPTITLGSVEKDGATIAPVNGVLTVPGVGVYEVEDGVVVFDPEATFAGVAPAVPVVATTDDGYTQTAKYTAVVGAVIPSTEQIGEPGQPVKVEKPYKDIPGVVPGTIGFIDPENPDADPKPNTPLTVPGEGVWTITPDGKITFEPEDGFTKTPTPVNVGGKGEGDIPVTPGTVTITVADKPVAGVDSKTFGLPVTPQQSSEKDAATAFVPADAGKTPEEMFPKLTAIKAADKDTEFKLVGADAEGNVVVADQGTYKVDPATGVVTFTPFEGFVGAADPVTVTLSVKDAKGTVTGTYAAMYSPVVVPAIPSTEQIGEPGKPVKVEKPYKDIPGVNPDTIVLIDPNNPGTQPEPRKPLKVPGEGTWTIDDDGKITFTPEAGFTKTPTPITVGGKDEGGIPVTPGTVTITVADKPAAGEDSKTFGLPVTTQYSSDKDAATAFVPADAGKDPEEMFSVLEKRDALKDAGKTVAFTVSNPNPAQGTYTVDADGVVTFEPKEGFVGAADPATVTLTVKKGDTVTGTYTAMYSPVVVPVIPSQTKTGEPGQPVTTDNPYKDIPGVVPGSIGLIDPKNPDADPKKELKVPGEGTWTIDDDGKITFTPEDGFTKTPTPITVGGEGEGDGENKIPVKPGTVTIIVADKPVAGVDSKTFGLINKKQKSSDKDTATKFVPADAGKSPEEMFPKLAAIKAADKTVEFTVSGGDPAQGTYTVDADGVVTFEPEKGFVGAAEPATVTLSVKDAKGTVTGTYTAMYSPVVVPEIPSTEQIGEPGKPGKVEKPYKDIPGVDPNSIGLIDPKTPDADPTDKVYIPGEGTWTIDGDGKITFTPDDGFTKIPTPINVGGKTKDGDPVKPGTVTIVVEGNPEVPGWVKKIIPFTPLLLIPLLGGIAGSSGTPIVPGSSTPGQPASPAKPAAPAENGAANNGAANNGAAQKGIAKPASAPKGVSKPSGLANTGVSGVTAAFALAIMSMIAGLGVLVVRRNRKQ